MWGSGTGPPSQRDWQPQRFGPSAAQWSVAYREQLMIEPLAAAGVPAELVALATAGDSREAWRRFLHSTIAPVARIVSAETARVVGAAPVPIDFSALHASDLQGRARAYRQLTESGMTALEARRICGF